jgi:predicted pyridoxine 5'-phosphate oxidase superfamily flavin-nucleotide-binding protein
VPNIVRTEAELEALYGVAAGAALFKEIDYISDHYRSFIDASPFVVVATSGADGLDCTPRGDPAGFVRVVDRHTVMLPDRRGNNRLDTLRNLVRDPRISLLFLIPGDGRTLRINGRAEINIDPELCAGVFPMPQGAGALPLMEPRAACRCQEAAQHRRHDQGAAGRFRRRGLRARLSATAEGNHLLK